MNRNERRAAAKRAKQTVSHAAPEGTLTPSSEVGELLARARRLLQQRELKDAEALYRQAVAFSPKSAEAHYYLGNALRQQEKWKEAEAHYRQAVALKSNFAEAHTNLGSALYRQGKPDEAAAHYQQAVALEPDSAEAHTNLGNAFHKLGKLDDAVSHYHRATTLNPDFAQAYNSLGNALQDQGKAHEAEAQYRRALALDPHFAAARNNLGNALNQQGNLDEAVTEYQRALALQPDFGEAYNNLGAALHDQGRIAEAVVQYRRALALAPDSAQAHSNLGKAMLEAGDPTQALQAIRRSLQIAETENTKLLFVQCLQSMDYIPDGVDLRGDLIRALSEPWGRSRDLSRFAAILLKSGSTAGLCIRRVANALPSNLPSREAFSPSELAELGRDQLLRCLLESTIVCDIELEKFLTAVRRQILEEASASVEPQSGRDASRFYCALAQQCFINEYVFSCTNHEKEIATSLQSRVAEALTSGADIAEPWLIAVAAFLPLAALPTADLLLQRSWSVPVARLLTWQVKEVQEERQLQTSVPRLTAIDDEVSLAVQQQYEENPYPRWTTAAPVGRSTTIDAHLRRQFPRVSIHGAYEKRRTKILIAGCGTGQHSIETARRFADAQVLAIDLSLSSLGYAKRKTCEFGLNNIEYGQADILQLQTVGRTFDIIEASGVLHHLADPMAGWRVLLSMLRPGGFMRLGFYSQLARQELIAARTFIAQRGYGSSAEDIRRCRHELTEAHDGKAPVKVTGWTDFFATSTCRDLLFHVQEHQLTLPQICSFLQQGRLEFLGFELSGHVLLKYQTRFPDDKTLTNLTHWHIFETENCDTFAGMYQFWIRKP